jgi:hypothetical protein
MTSLRQASFLGAVLLAGLFGLGFIPVVELAGSWIDSTTAAGLYLTLTAALHVAWLGPTRSLKLGAVLLVVGAGTMITLFSSRLLPTALALTAALAVSRARILCRGRLDNPWRVELCIAAGALAVVWLIESPSMRGIALSVWGYWLVQSAYLLVLSHGDARALHAARDPFDAAVERATELMDEGGSR